MDNVAFTDKYLAAKSFTDFAIQNHYIEIGSNSVDTAKNVAEFFNTLMENIK